MKASTMKSAESSLGVAGRRPGRGVSLIEALVAMAVMAFGMLGVLGLQATLRANADLSKQRSEATRLAEEKIEAWRSFSVIPTGVAGTKSYAGIATEAAETLSSFVSNTTYTRTVTVTESAPVGHKTLVVDVSWPDRSGTTQNVRLFSVAAQIPPGLAATLVAPPQGAGGTREPEGRARGIPLQAKNFGDGTSGFVPPGGTGVGWLFNNTTGLITSVCSTAVTNNAALVLTDFASCNTTQKYQLLAGFIRFDLTTPPTTTSVVNPTGDVPGTVQAEVVQTAPAAFVGTVNCLHAYADANLVPSAPFKVAGYFCAIPVSAVGTPALAWSGRVQIRTASMPLANPIAASGAYATDAATANRKVCRIRAAATYTDVVGPLINENLIVIQAGNGTTASTCPSTPNPPPPTFGHQPTP